MLVKDIMNKNVVVGKPDVTIREVSKVMAQLHIGSMVIVEGGKIVGIVTERNVLNSVARGKDPDITVVSDIMSKDVVTIEPDKKVEEAVDLMVKHKIKKLPVVRDDKIVGIITASDIVVVEPKLIENIASLISIKLPKYSGG